VTYSPLEDVYLLDSGRKVKRLELRVYGAPPLSVPFQWAVMSSPATAFAMWLTTGLDLWATQDDEQVETSEANAGPRLVLLDRSSGALG
jgi:hypothetical protein